MDNSSTDLRTVPPKAEITTQLRSIAENLDNPRTAMLHLLCAIPRLHLVEQLYLSEIRSLENALRAANDMFEVFADIYINKSVSEECGLELDILNKYLQTMMKIHSLPSTKYMHNVHDENLLKGSG